MSHHVYDHTGFKWQTEQAVQIEDVRGYWRTTGYPYEVVVPHMGARGGERWPDRQLRWEIMWRNYQHCMSDVFLLEQFAHDCLPMIKHSHARYSVALSNRDDALLFKLAHT